jgi:hypothetical protein
MTRLLAALLFGLLMVGPGRSDPVTDSLFSEGVFSGLPAGQEIRYAHVRTGPDAAEFRPVAEGSMVLTRATEDASHLSLTMVENGRTRNLADFPVAGGNPVLLVFLESVVRSMAALTGGSPFYIRNRLKDSLRAGGDPTEFGQPYAGQTVTARAVTLRPFASDPNAHRMGDFADLTLRFVISTGVPGHLLSLTADTPDPATGYHETITLTDRGKGSE